MWDQAEQGLKSGWCFSDGICRWDQKYLQSDIMGTRFRRVTFQLAEANMTSWQRIGCLVSGLLESLCGSHDGLGGDRRGHAPQGQISCATQELTQEMLLHIKLKCRHTATWPVSTSTDCLQAHGRNNRCSVQKMQLLSQVSFSSAVSLLGVCQLTPDL